MDHCLGAALNILAGGRVILRLDDLLRLVHKPTLRMGHRRRLANFIKRRGCKFADQAILPYQTVDNRLVWTKLQVKELSCAETVRVLSCANHLNDYLDEFPGRVMLQIDKLPLSHGSLFHCSHVINAKFGTTRGDWYLRDTEGDWYSTRSYDPTTEMSRMYSSKFFNTFKDAHQLKIWWLTPVTEQDVQAEPTEGYMQRVADFPGRSLTDNMFQRGPGNLHQATKEGSLIRDDADRSHKGRKASRKQRSKLAYRQQRESQKHGDNLELSEHQTTMTAQQQSEISSEYSESSQSRRSSSSGVMMAGRPPKRNYARSRSSSSKHSQRGSSAGQQQEFADFYAHIEAENHEVGLYDGQQEGRSASADQQTPQKRRRMKTPPEDPWKKMLQQRQIIRQMQRQQ